MARLRRLTGGGFSLHYVLLLAALPLVKTNFEYLVGQLESFLFSYIFTKSPTKPLERSFSKWADEMRGIAALDDEKEQRSALEDFVASHFASGIREKESELEDALRRYSTDSMQKYRTKYMFAAMTEYVDLAFAGSRTSGDLDAYWPLELEHILPNNPTDALRARWEQQNPRTDYEDYKEKLGNFILLEKPINIVVGRDYFEEKAPEYRKSGNYLARSLVRKDDVGINSSINRINMLLRSYESWDRKAIDDHQDMYIELAKRIWSVSSSDL